MLKYHASSPDSKMYGFTLIEVMVALAIFAASAAMLIVSDGNSISQTHHMKNKVLSVQVADQHLNKIYTSQRRLENGTKGRMQKYAGYDWYVREVIRNTRKEGFQQIIVDVFLGSSVEPPGKNDVPILTLTSYMRRLKSVRQ
ncbi:MAG: type II secretion system minor pseudopilin GspI [Candidatus Endonucleobacter bathymodioli]|uniref:Type II secretion system protein I n=1 Tax=Candidatus Endonucleibacter bathymodioli TaxID=539814 RepID=A0AA90SXD9_9GAMM|nr:type II secretion system minor pseudopilin GspI [Candidatus Endonucleobacter bathymodioli]